MVSGSRSLTLGSDGVLHSQFNNSLYAVNNDGSTKWIFEGHHNGSIGAHIEGLNSTIYATWKGGLHTQPDTLFALDALDGSIKWKREMDGLRKLSEYPALAKDGTIYLTSALVHCVNGTTIDAIDSVGDVKWTFNITGCGGLRTIGADGTLFVNSGTSLDALQPATGAVKWSLALGDRAGDRLDVFTKGDNVFVSDRNHTHSVLFSLSNQDGSVLWHEPFPSWSDDVRIRPWMVLGSNDEVFINSVNLTDGTCGLRVFDFNGSALRKLPCLPDSPSYNWKYNSFVTIPVGNTVLEYSGRDGSLLWNVSIGEELSKGVNIGYYGIVFVWTTGNSADAHAYAIQGGKVLWSVQTPGAMQQVMSYDLTTYISGAPPFVNGLEIVAVTSEGAEMWRYKPTEAAVEVV